MIEFQGVTSKCASFSDLGWPRGLEQELLGALESDNGQEKKCDNPLRKLLNVWHLDTSHYAFSLQAADSVRLTGHMYWTRT